MGSHECGGEDFDYELKEIFNYDNYSTRSKVLS